MSRWIAAFCVVFLCFVPGLAEAFSPIGDIDHCTAEELSQLGLRVRLIENPVVNAHPPLEWIEIEFDARSIAAEKNVLMTVWQIGADRKTTGALQTEREHAPDGKMTLKLAVRDDDLFNNSRFDVRILDPKKTDPHGYRMRLARLVELARRAVGSPDGKRVVRKEQDLAIDEAFGKRGPYWDMLRAQGVLIE